MCIGNPMLLLSDIMDGHSPTWRRAVAQTTAAVSMMKAGITAQTTIQGSTRGLGVARFAQAILLLDDVPQSLLSTSGPSHDSCTAASSGSAQVKKLFKSFKERFKPSGGKGWHSKMVVYMDDWFGGCNDTLTYLRTGELPHRMGRFRGM